MNDDFESAIGRALRGMTAPVSVDPHEGLAALERTARAHHRRNQAMLALSSLLIVAAATFLLRANSTQASSLIVGAPGADAIESAESPLRPDSDQSIGVPIGDRTEASFDDEGGDGDATDVLVVDGEEVSAEEPVGAIEDAFDDVVDVVDEPQTAAVDRTRGRDEAEPTEADGSDATGTPLGAVADGDADASDSRSDTVESEPADVGGQADSSSAFEAANEDPPPRAVATAVPTARPAAAAQPGATASAPVARATQVPRATAVPNRESQNSSSQSPRATSTPTFGFSRTTTTPVPVARATASPRATAAPTRPTATAVPRRQTDPTAVPTPRPTARPTATATPRPTATETPRAVATARPAPTSTTVPTATPRPTPTTRPTVTPTPVVVPPTPAEVAPPRVSAIAPVRCGLLASGPNVSLAWDPAPNDNAAYYVPIWNYATGGREAHEHFSYIDASQVTTAFGGPTDAGGYWSIRTVSRSGPGGSGGLSADATVCRRGPNGLLPVDPISCRTRVVGGQVSIAWSPTAGDAADRYVIYSRASSEDSVRWVTSVEPDRTDYTTSTLTGDPSSYAWLVKTRSTTADGERFYSDGVICGGSTSEYIPGDSIDRAVRFGGGHNQLSGTLVQATIEPGEEALTFNGSESSCRRHRDATGGTIGSLTASVWVEIAVAEVDITGDYKFELFAPWGGQVAVYAAPRGAEPMEQLGCSSLNSWNTNGSILTVRLDAGDRYLVQVFGQSWPAGVSDPTHSGPSGHWSAPGTGAFELLIRPS